MLELIDWLVEETTHSLRTTLVSFHYTASCVSDDIGDDDDDCVSMLPRNLLKFFKCKICLKLFVFFDPCQLPVVSKHLQIFRLLSKHDHLLLSVGLSRPLAPIPNVPWFPSETLALYKSLIYLLPLVANIVWTFQNRMTSTFFKIHIYQLSLFIYRHFLHVFLQKTTNTATWKLLCKD